MASQSLLARGLEVSTIDIDTEMIRVARDFGFKVYYGDGTRLDVLRASGAGKASAILVCVDNRNATDRIVELVKAEFPLAKLLVRSYDRGHALRLVRAGVDANVRETFESAMLFGKKALMTLGVPEDEAAEIGAFVRNRDAERFTLEVAGTPASETANLLLSNITTRPTPFTTPKRLLKPEAPADTSQTAEP